MTETSLPPQAPLTSAWRRRLLGAFHFSGVFWYRFHLFGVRILPDWLLHLLLPVFTFGFLIALGSVRRAVAVNLEAVIGPPKSRFDRVRRVFRTLRNHAWCMTETYEGLAGRARGALEVEGEHFWHQVDRGEPAFILVTAHVGHWEVGSHLTPSEKQRRVHVVREPELDERSQHFLQELLRERTGDRYQVHFAQANDLSLGARLLQFLRAGELVALQGDRPRAGGRVVQTELFGRSYEMPAGPAALARAAGVPLLPVFVLRRGRRSSLLVFRPPVRVDPTLPRREALAQATERLAAEVETAIRREPHQWFCFRPLRSKP